MNADNIKKYDRIGNFFFTGIDHAHTKSTIVATNTNAVTKFENPHKNSSQNSFSTKMCTNQGKRINPVCTIP